jgi:hypothetical protein
MPRPLNGGYEVLCSAVVAETLRQLQGRATRRGQGKSLASAFKQIVAALSKDPNVVGEPLYRLPRVRTVVVSPLVIDFAVSEDRPLVYIKSVKLLSARN